MELETFTVFYLDLMINTSNFFFQVDNKRSSISRWPKGAIVCSTGHNSPMVAYRSPTSAGWNKLTVKPAKLKVKSSGSLAVSVGNALYFIGGVGNVQMWSFSLSQDAWKLLCAEQVGDFYSALVVLYAYCPFVRP